MSEQITYLKDTSRYPKVTRTEVKQPKIQITSEEYNKVVEALVVMEESGFGIELAGFVVVDSTSDLPKNPTKEERILGYLIEGELYVFVGGAGDTLGGIYKNCGYIRGEKGDKGDKLLYSDLTSSEKEELASSSKAEAEKAAKSAASAEKYAKDVKDAIEKTRWF